MPRYFTQFGGARGGGKTDALRRAGLVPEPLDWSVSFSAYPMIPDIHAPEFVATDTGLVDAAGSPIMRAANPVGFGRDEEW